MAFIDKYPYEVVLYVADEMCIDVTTLVTIGELKEAIINSEYYEEEFVEDFLETTRKDIEKEAEKQRMEKEHEELRMQREKEHEEWQMQMKQRQKEEVQKKHDEIRLFYLGAEKYEKLYGPVLKDRNLHQRLSESSRNIEVHSEKIRNVDGRQSSQPRSQNLRCWSCNQNSHMKRDCPNKIKTSHNVKENSSVKVEARSGSMTLVGGSACKDASLKINLEGLGGNSENLDKKMADADDILPGWLFLDSGDNGTQPRLKVLQPVQDEQSTSPDDDTPPRLIVDDVYGPVHGEQHPAIRPLDLRGREIQEEDSLLNGVDGPVHSKQRHAVWPLDRRGSKNPEEDDFFKDVDTTVHGEQHPAVDPQKEEDNCSRIVDGLIHRKQQPAVLSLDGRRASLQKEKSYLEVVDTPVHGEQQPAVGPHSKEEEMIVKDIETLNYSEQHSAVTPLVEEVGHLEEHSEVFQCEQQPVVELLCEEESQGLGESECSLIWTSLDENVKQSRELVQSEQLNLNTNSSVSISKVYIWKVLFEDTGIGISSKVLRDSCESDFTAGMAKGSFGLKILSWPKGNKVGIG